jgi:uncharacterized protein
MKTIIFKAFVWLVAGMIVFTARSSNAAQEITKNHENKAVQQLEVPALQDRVMDLAGILRDSEAIEFKSKLKRLEAETTAQMAIPIIPDLQGEVLEKYSIRVARTWKLGQVTLSNGVLILVAMRDRALRIEVGLGLESILTNEICKEIIENEMVPLFKQGEYYRGIDSGVNAIVRLLDWQQGKAPAKE